MAPRWLSVQLDAGQVWKRRKPGRRVPALRLVERTAPFTWSCDVGKVVVREGVATFVSEERRVIYTEGTIRNAYDPVQMDPGSDRRLVSVTIYLKIEVDKSFSDDVIDNIVERCLDSGDIQDIVTTAIDDELGDEATSVRAFCTVQEATK